MREKVCANSNQKFYDKYFESIYAASNILTERQYKEASIEFDVHYQKVMPDDKSANILDLGCGTGQFLYYLMGKGYQNIFGIDVSPQQIEYCEKNITRKVKLVDAFEFLKETDRVYDIIAAHDVLEHVSKEKMLNLISSIYRSLKDKGVFIVRVPNMSNPFSLDSRYRDFTHETGFTDKSLYQVLWNAGFRDIQLSSTRIIVRSVRNRVRSLLIVLLQKLIRFLYYIQDYSVPSNLGKNLIVISRK